MLTVWLSILPIVILLICLLFLKFSASKSGAIAFAAAFLISLPMFRPGVFGMSVILAKGFGLALFVIFIIWGAMFLYNVVNETGALEVINKNISILVDDRMVQFILLAWAFAPFMQGIAGFGIPVIVATPLLIALGFDPLKSVAAVLIGHCWAISFGSMGSSIYAIDMVTNTDVAEIVPYMAVYGTIAMFLMGITVALIYDGPSVIKKALVYILPASCTMGLTLYILARLTMVSVIGLMTGLVGMITILLIYKLRSPNGRKEELYRTELTLADSLLPYILIVILSIAFFILDPSWKIVLSYPEYTTLNGITVACEEAYVKFNLLKFPFCIIMMASLLSMAVYWNKGRMNRNVFRKVLQATVKKCVPTSITLVFLLCMAQLMMDAGMINAIAEALVSVAGNVYPVLSPFIGLLGAFITGSNTNSNVLFGNLQEVASNALALSPAVMCAVQSIGASIGGAIGPTTVALGATSAQIIGRESEIYKLTLLPILISTGVLGAVNFILINAAG